MSLEPFSTGLITSLISEGLVVLASHGIQKATLVAKLRDAIRNSAESDPLLVSTIRSVLSETAETPLLASNQLIVERLRQFLQSPTAESIVRQIYSDFMSEGKRPKCTEQLLEEFTICLAYYSGLAKDDVAQLATGLFNVIRAGCQRALGVAIDQGVLSAHEANSIARDRILRDELQAIERNLEFLTSGFRLNQAAVAEFEKLYREQVADRYRLMTVPHSDRVTRIIIEKIFVAPSFVRVLGDKREDTETITLDDFLTPAYRSVVLADPGGGKTTLAQKICYELSRNYEKRVVGGRALTPVLVTLREYSVKKKKDSSSIVQFMESEVTSKYQLAREPPPRAFEYLLHNGHILVIFDGLDELLEAGHRRDVVHDIESFCNLFPSVPVVVTSRVVGYEKSPLDPSVFDVYRIAPFFSDQVEQYVDKWFCSELGLSLEDRKPRAEAFMRESRIVTDLRSNPLMLALMCNLYRGAGYIPRNRPEVYRKCAEMLFERWDPSRGIWVYLPISEPKVLLSHLAYWIYCDESRQSGVRETELVGEASKFLCPSRFEAKEEAEKASREFVEFCRGRAWVFTDIETSPDGQLLYKFTHKTFLEYFTAAHIVRKNSTPEKLWKLLGPKIAQRAWDVVAQLAFQMLHEQVDHASDELLRLLIREAGRDKSARWAYLSFGARCLQFLFSSPKSIRALTVSCLRLIAESASQEPGMISEVELANTLLAAAPECRSTVVDSLEASITSYAKNPVDEVALRALFGLDKERSTH